MISLESQTLFRVEFHVDIVKDIVVLSHFAVGINQQIREQNKNFKLLRGQVFFYLFIVYYVDSKHAVENISIGHMY